MPPLTEECGQAPKSAGEFEKVLEQLNIIGVRTHKNTSALRGNIDRICGPRPCEPAKGTDATQTTTPNTIIARLHELMRDIDSGINDTQQEIARLSKL